MTAISPLAAKPLAGSTTITTGLPIRVVMPDRSVGVIINYAGPVLLDYFGESFVLAADTTNFKVIANGQPDPVAVNMNFMLYWGGWLFYQNAVGGWFSKWNIAGTWIAAGDPRVKTVFGLPKALLTAHSTGGLASTLHFGVPLVRQRTYAAGLASALRFGVDVVRQGVHAVGIASTARYGVPGRISGGRLSGIPTHAVFGVPIIRQRTHAVGLASSLHFGVPAPAQKPHPVGIATHVAFGVPRARNLARMVGIASTQRFGTIVGSNHPQPNGVPSHVLFGIPRPNQRITRTGIASTQRFGLPGIRLPSRLTPIGIASRIAFGVPHAGLIKSVLRYLVTATTTFNLQETARQITLGFGDGYNQVLPDGLTPVDRIMTLSWNEIPTADADRMLAWVRSKPGAVSFVAPNDTTPRLWLPTKWSRSHPYPDADSITITFEDRTPAPLLS